MNFQELAVSMIKCEQTVGQSVYQHGVSVNQHFEELICNLDSFSFENWKIPNWIKEYKDKLLSNIYDKDIISKYTIYHDCGKSWCLTLDENGKQHFPNHAEISKQKFLEAGGDSIVANLIGWDMCIHQDSSIEIQDKLENEWSIKDACTLLLASLAEIHSNAKMFGGIESNSFKIKYKQIERRGKQICKYYFGG
jgi:hypothetical protein